MRSIHRKSLAFVLFMFSILAGITLDRFISWVARNRAYNRTLTQCVSDVIYPVGQVLLNYHSMHDGLIPDRMTLRIFAESIGIAQVVVESLDENNDHYVWNNLAVSNEVDHMRPIFWCNPELHGQFIGVLLVNGKSLVEVSVISKDELAGLLSIEIGKVKGDAVMRGLRL